MFAFAVADRGRRELFMRPRSVRREAAVLHATCGGSSFASELKVLAALPGGRREIDDESLAAYLCLNYVPGTATMLQGVHRIASSDLAAVDGRRRSRAGVYWTPPDPREPRSALVDAARRSSVWRRCSMHRRGSRLRSDVPVGIFLSGGIDSSLVARSAARSGRLAAAYCLTFADASYSEWPKAEATARQLGRAAQRSPDWTRRRWRIFLQLVEHADDPLADSSALAVWTLAREVCAPRARSSSAATAATSCSADI